MLTESNKILEVLKSRYITGLSAPCKNASPLAAPIAIFNLFPHGRQTEIPVLITTANMFNPQHNYYWKIL